MTTEHTPEPHDMARLAKQAYIADLQAKIARLKAERAELLLACRQTITDCELCDEGDLDITCPRCGLARIAIAKAEEN